MGIQETSIAAAALGTHLSRNGNELSGIATNVESTLEAFGEVTTSFEELESLFQAMAAAAAEAGDEDGKDRNVAKAELSEALMYEAHEIEVEIESLKTSIEAGQEIIKGAMRRIDELITRIEGLGHATS